MAQTLLCIVLICCLTISAHAGNYHRRKPRPDEPRPPRPGPEPIDKQPGNGNDERGRKTDLPDEMQMNVPMRGKGSVKLNLKKSEALNATLPVYIGTGRNAYTQLNTKEREDFVVYRDLDKRASFVMWNDTGRHNQGNSRGNVGMRGIFDENGESFSMEPLLSSRISRTSMDITEDQDAPFVFSFNDTDFVMTTFNHSEHLNTPVEQVMNEQTEQLFEDIKAYVNESMELAHEIPRYNYEVETLMVVDYAIFDKFLRASSAIDYKTREIEAIDDIRFYFAHILNGMAMRYESVDEPEFQMRIVPVGLYIAKTPSASFWTESVKEAFHYTEAYKALDLFQDWINDRDANLPPFDIAALFTAYNLFNGYRDGRRRTINGLANIASVCNYRRASINYDQNPYGSIQNAAHESAHNLGAYHDGYNNECLSKDQYIMATSPGVLNPSNFDNVFEFSSCSKRYFWETLLYLSKENNNCLLERTNTNEYWNYEFYLETYPGQRYSADELCKLSYGPQSKYCGGGNLDEAICEVMYCWRPQYGDCYAHVEQRGADGTSCGDRKWCMNGRCVSDQRAAPVANPTCIYGDFLGIVEYVEGYRCKDVERVAQHLCYDDKIASSCCETCKRIRDTVNQGCEFGDKKPDSCRKLESRDCYSQNKNDECCATCANAFTGVAGCEYGDRAFHLCQDALNNPRYCYLDDTYNRQCCETCPKLADGPAGCEFGNKNFWCDDFKNNLNRCYDASIATACCATCIPEGPAGCEFGDINDYCTPEDCDDPYWKERCCRTCSNDQPTTTVAVTVRSGDCPNTDADECQYWIYDNRDCYTHSDACCNKCKQYETGVATCKFGDMFSWCASYVNRYDGSVCDDSDILENCCMACAPYKEEDNNGEGDNPDTDQCTEDSFTWCPDYVNRNNGRVCDDNYILENCCLACAPYQEEDNNGEGGNPDTDQCTEDAFTWCPDYVNRHKGRVCDDDNYILENCCLACAPYQEGEEDGNNSGDGNTDTGSEECFDDAPWCNAIISGACYDAGTEITCCATCKSLRRSTTNCVYGDLYSWCSAADYCRDFSEECCETCA